jgi:hypothetical protein
MIQRSVLQGVTYTFRDDCGRIVARFSWRRCLEIAMLHLIIIEGTGCKLLVEGILLLRGGNF